jgi:hypothetical protein
MFQRGKEIGFRYRAREERGPYLWGTRVFCVLCLGSCWIGSALNRGAFVSFFLLCRGIM